MRRLTAIVAVCVGLALTGAGRAAEPKETKPVISDYFPPPESKGGWRCLLPEKGEPNAEQKAAIARAGGVDWDKLKEAWEFNLTADGATGLLVIRHGQIVGEWYKDGGRDKTFNIYSSSKAYTSLAYGILLADIAADKGSNDKKLTLDTKVCNEQWLPESLPLPDQRKADITLRNLLNMASGLGEEPVPEKPEPFEYALGRVEGSPFAKLKNDPGKAFHYSNAGVAHLVLVFRHATGQDEYPYLKERVFNPIGIENLKWTQIGGDGHIGPLSQGYSGVLTTPREHARFLWLAMHKGEWAGKRLAPAEHYDFAWKGQEIKPEYGAQWWVYPRHKNAPNDLVQTAGAFNNHGYVLPSKDLIFVRLGDGKKFPKGDWENELVMKVLAAVNP